MATKRELIREKQKKQYDKKLVESVLTKDEVNTSPKKQKRTRRFCLTTYIDVQALSLYLSRCTWVQHWCYCTHDRDYNEDNTPKIIHTHVLLYTYEAKTSSAIKKNFDSFAREYYSSLGLEAQNTLVQECHDSSAQYRYLRHLDNPEKAPYTADEVFCDDLAYWNTLSVTNGMTDSTKNCGLAILNDILNGVDSYTMCQRYGKEYIYHASHYKSMVRDISSENARQSFATFRDMCEFALADSEFSRYEEQVFYSVLAYVQCKFSESLSTNEQVERFLKG